MMPTQASPGQVPTQAKTLRAFVVDGASVFDKVANTADVLIRSTSPDTIQGNDAAEAAISWARIAGLPNPAITSRGNPRFNKDVKQYETMFSLRALP